MDTSGKRLHNGLIETCVVIGQNEMTGLQPDKPNRRRFHSGEDLLYASPYMSQILAVLTGQAAYSFRVQVEQQNQATVGLQPAIARGRASVRRSISTSPNGEDSSNFSSQRRSGIKRRGGRRMSLITSQPPKLDQNAVPDPTVLTANLSNMKFSFSTDLIQGLPTFCFPDGAYVFKKQPNARIHSLVLTDINGVHFYAVCLTFYQQYLVTMNNEGSGGCNLEPINSTDTDLEGFGTCYTPTCICLISSYPYFCVLKDCLSYFHGCLKKRSRQEATDILVDFIRKLSLIPVPPTGQLVTVSEFFFSSMDFPLVVRLTPSPNPDKSVVDLPLHLPFLSMSVDSILDVVQAILTQQKLVFISSDYSLLTIYIECFLVYILPFKWRHIYVPIVPTNLITFVESPGLFIMGCHTKHRFQVQQVPELVCVDIDNGIITTCQTLNIPCLPFETRKSFHENYQRLQKHFDMAMVGQPTMFDQNELKNARTHFLLNFERELTGIFLDLMASIFRDIPDYLHKPDGQSLFQRLQFVNNQLSEDRFFYEEVLKTDSFKQFLKLRFEERPKYYIEIEKKHRLSRTSSIKKRVSMSSTSLPLSPYYFSFAPENMLKIQEFRLPTYQPNISLYYGDCIVRLEEELKEIKDTEKSNEDNNSFDDTNKKSSDSKSNLYGGDNSSRKASLLYLLGMYCMALGKTVKGLKVLNGLCIVNLEIFPTEIVSKVLSTLSEFEKSSLEQESFFQQSAFWKNIKVKKIERYTIDYDDDLPQSPVDLKEFKTYIQRFCESDFEGVKRLFNVLSIFGKQQHVVSPEVYEGFYDSWKETESEVKQLTSLAKELYEIEDILKVSKLVKSDKGMGRVVLTQRRIFFQSHGSSNFDEVVRLKHITNIEKFELKSFLQPINGVPSLKITYNAQGGRQQFTVNLNSDRDVWYRIMWEMWSGKMVSMTTHDVEATRQASFNVLMIDALNNLLAAEEEASPLDIENAIKDLCFFTQERVKRSHTTEEVKSHLLHKLSPSENELQKFSVENMIYIPGEFTEDTHSTPMLWCALGSGNLGQIKVYNASTWMLESAALTTQSRISCMVHVGKTVWVGCGTTNSKHSIIHIIDATTFSCNKQLSYPDIITDITVNPSHSIAFVASINGEITLCNTKSLENIKTIKPKATFKQLMAIHWHQEKLWCSTRKCLLVIDSEGKVVNSLDVTLETGGSPKTAEELRVESFLIHPDNNKSLQVWTACGGKGKILCFLYKKEKFKLLGKVEVNEKCVTRIIHINNKIWGSTQEGNLFIVDAQTCTLERTLEKVHNDKIKSLCTAEDRYIISGAASNDGKIAIWRPSRPDNLL